MAEDRNRLVLEMGGAVGLQAANEIAQAVGRGRPMFFGMKGISGTWEAYVNAAWVDDPDELLSSELLEFDPHEFHLVDTDTAYCICGWTHDVMPGDPIEILVTAYKEHLPEST